MAAYEMQLADARLIVDYYRSASNKMGTGSAVTSTVVEWHSMKKDLKQLQRMLVPTDPYTAARMGVYGILMYAREDAAASRKMLNDLFEWTIRGALPDMICCLLKALGAIDESRDETLKRLKRIKGIMTILYYSAEVDVGTWASAIINNVTGSVQRSIREKTEQAINNISESITHMSEPLSKWIDGLKEAVKVCSPLDEFAWIMVQSINMIENQLIKALGDFKQIVDLKGNYIDFRVKVEYRKEWSKRMLELLDYVIRAFETGDLCRDTSAPTVGEINKIIASRVSDGLDIAMDDGRSQLSDLDKLEECWK